MEKVPARKVGSEIPDRDPESRFKCLTAYHIPTTSNILRRKESVTIFVTRCNNLKSVRAFEIV